MPSWFLAVLIYTLNRLRNPNKSTIRRENLKEWICKMYLLMQKNILLMLDQET